MVSVGIIFFAFSTLISWSYYGDRAIDYLLGKKAITPYRILYVLFVFIGAVLHFPVVINFCDAMNGLMAIPNLIAIALLSPLVAKLTRDYFKRMNTFL
jgi:AGCS family alanine or glycine:cation symporter